MHELFPVGTGISKVRGIVLLIRDSNGTISLSELADEAEEEIDDLLPLIDACKMLGFINLNGSDVALTDDGIKLTKGSPYKIIREKLKDVEPFKSTIAALRKKSMTTEELMKFLGSKRVIVKDTEDTVAALKELFQHWGVGSKLLRYNEEDDTWSVRA